MRQLILAATCAVLALTFLGCYCPMTCASRHCPAAAAPQWVKSEVYFGRELPGGGQVSPADWADFLNKVVTPRFPKGLTIYDAYGQMQHADGRIEKQSTWVIILLHPHDPAADRAIQEVIDAYRKQFSKAQVAMVNQPLASTAFFAD